MTGSGLQAVEPCRVAVVGAGYMAREHIRALRAITGVTVAGIHSRTRAKAEALASEQGGFPVFESIAELHERTRAQLLVVAVPELSTNAVCRAAFDYPWTLLIEKPAGYDLADAIEIEAAARARGSRAFVAFNRRYYGSTRVALDDLAGRPGPRLITVLDQEDPARALAAGQPPLVVANWMFANSVHLVDYLRMMGRGPIAAVHTVVPWNPDDPRYVVAHIVFDSGDIGLYEAVWCGPGPWSVTVSTEAIRWELRPVEQAAFQRAGTRSLEPVPSDPWDVEFKPGLRAQAGDAVAEALGRRTSLPTLADGLETMRLVRDIYRVRAR
jgi:predicted dehydrogenase